MHSPRKAAPWRAITCVLAVGALVISLLSPSPARADDPGEESLTFVKGETINGQLTVNDTFDISSTSGLTSADVGSQCVPLNAGGSYCIGSSSNDGVYSISGQGGVAFGTEPALQWIVDEAKDFVHIAYDVPRDGRIDDYAQPQIRAYVVARIMGIVDKAAYGQPLTSDEQGALDWLNAQISAMQERIAQAAYDEWQDWEARGCDYYPPPAPDWAAPGLGLPPEIFSYCHMHPGLTVYSLPPMPSADDFRTWGLYRVAANSGLQLPATANQQTSVAATAAYLEMGAMLASAGAGLWLTTSSAAAFGTFLTALGGFLPATYGSLGAVGAVSQVGAAVGMAAGATVVAVVVFALLTIAITSWQLYENLQVGPQLAASLADAQRNTDPLGLKALAVSNAGKDFREGMAENPPPYRRNGLELRLLSMMATSVGVGTDRTGTWAGSAHTSSDYRFTLDGNDIVDQILVPKADGTYSTVWFSKKWMIERTADGVEHAILSLEYLNADGKIELARRAGDGFLITTPDPDGKQAPTTRMGSMSFLSATGQHELVGLAPQSAPVLGGPRPTAAGSLYPGRVINLRPNPVDAQGNFALGTFVDGYRYDWQVRYQDNGWHDVSFENRPQGSNPSYGARFVPDRPGQYEATVTMTSTTDPQAPPQQGLVNFTVASPDLTLPILALHDDGGSDVRLQLQAQLSTPLEGQVKIAVQWPGELTSDDPGPVTTATMTCHNVDPFSCQTADSDRSTEPGDALTHTLSTTARLRDGVTVTVSDVNGTAVVTQKLAFDTTTRPSFAAPPAPEAGQIGNVQFDTYLSTLTVPVAVDGDLPNYAAATVIPSSDSIQSMAVIDPASGQPVPFAIDLFAGTDRAGRYLASVEKRGDDWLLIVRALPGAGDIGSTTVPVTIRQDDGKRATLFLTINPVVAPGGRYRGSLITDKDPALLGVTELPQLTPALTGGLTEWGPYHGRVCLSLTSSDDGAAHSTCGPAADIIGDGDNDFPYAELAPHGITGTMTAAAWLPEADEHAWDVPMTVRFILASGPPEIAGLRWDGDQLQTSITPGRTPANAAVPITDVSCTLDGVAVSACFDHAGGNWTPDGLTPGLHQLSIKVVDQARNYDTAALSFDVAADQPGNDQPDSDQPGTDQPGNNHSGDDHSGDDQPGNNQSDADQPGNDQPGDSQTGNDQTGSDHSAGASVPPGGSDQPSAGGGQPDGSQAGSGTGTGGGSKSGSANAGDPSADSTTASGTDQSDTSQPGVSGDDESREAQPSGEPTSSTAPDQSTPQPDDGTGADQPSAAAPSANTDQGAAQASLSGTDQGSGQGTLFAVLAVIMLAILIAIAALAIRRRRMP